MIKYLLIILILQVFLFKYASGQIITITQRGIRVISIKVSAKFPDSTLALKELAPKDDSIQTKIQNEIDLTNKTVGRTFRNVSAPLNSALFVTSDFGERFHPILQRETLHAGIDLRANFEIVNAIANGIIVKEDYDTRSGNYIVIQHGNGIESIYCHLSKFLCRPGDLIFAGDRIAVSGATGAATAPHLHFAIKENGKFIDPIPLLRAIGKYNLKNK
jgi:murein DD-endopeptidase MepM/ murein hydrolase activator NlpD